jgi:hypothetical protein
MVFPVPRRGDEDEKHRKVQRQESQRFGRSMMCFLFLLVVAVRVAILSVERSGNVKIATVGTPAVRIKTTGTPAKPAAENRSRGSAVTSITAITEEQLQAKVDLKEKEVRAMKKKPGIMMEVDPSAMVLTKELQVATRELLIRRYGSQPVRVRVDLEFPAVVVEKDKQPSQDSFLIEMGPVDLIPCSVFYFLELARTFLSGSFMRNAGHVLQASTRNNPKKLSMPFQEYSPEFPHAKYTTGYAGRPSGPEWYVSIQDNTKAHGPGSQQKHNPHEADSLFGKVVPGSGDLTVIPRIHSTPQKEWLDEPHKIIITNMTILVATTDGTWLPWTPQRNAPDKKA